MVLLEILRFATGARRSTSGRLHGDRLLARRAQHISLHEYAHNLFPFGVVRLLCRHGFSVIFLAIR